MPLIVAFLFFFILLESAIISSPIVLVFLLCLMVLEKRRYVFVIGFFAGLLLDMLLLRTLGSTAMFIVSALFLVMLYQRKFEIASFYFIAFACFIVAIAYAMFFGIANAILQATISLILAILFFTFLSRVFIKIKPLEAP